MGDGRGLRRGDQGVREMTDLGVLDLSVKTFNAMNRLGLKNVEDVIRDLTEIHQGPKGYREDVENGLCRYFGGGYVDLGTWYYDDEVEIDEPLTYEDLTEMIGRPVLRESGQNYQCVLVLGIGGTEDEPRILFSDGGRSMMNIGKYFLTAENSVIWALDYAMPTKEEERVEELSNVVRAKDLDRRIKVSAQLAQQSLYDMCTAIKEMRDSKLYKELGYQNFEDYCEQEVGFKRRQAYKFIAVAEKLSDDFVHSNAQIGITKLSLLAELDEAQQAEIEQTTDLENTTVRELKGKIKSLEQQAEAAQTANDELTKSEREAWVKVSKLQFDSEIQKDKIAELEQQIKELEERPIEVIASDDSAAEVRNLRLAMRELNAQMARDELARDLDDKKFRDSFREQMQADRDAAIEAYKKERDEEIRQLKAELEKVKASEGKDDREFKALLTNAEDSIRRLTYFISTHANKGYKAKLSELVKMIGG